MLALLVSALSLARHGRFYRAGRITETTGRRRIRAVSVRYRTALLGRGMVHTSAAVAIAGQERGNPMQASGLICGCAPKRIYDMSHQTLIVMRHAKSEWNAGPMADFDRPLAPRGQRDAVKMSRWLAGQPFAPGEIKSSTARRAAGKALRLMGVKVSMQ